MRYTGKALQKTTVYQNMELQPYFPADGLVEAVNVAIHLRRPLLLRGEPGSGKSYLAKAVAHELQLHYYEFNVKSTSKAREALYTYNHIAYLRDAQLVQSDRLNSTEAEKRERNHFYVNFGPIGEAFQSEKRAVVLIDEIDKADLDFPNDLLSELDNMRFQILELQGRTTDKNMLTVQAADDKRPIVFITSNDEKELPAPFLRRCLYHQIKFPDTEHLKEILRAHLKLKIEDKKDLVDQAVVRFEKLREEMKAKIGEGQKASTSELLDWFKAMTQDHAEETKSLEALALNQLPFPGVLIKNPVMYERYFAENTPAS